MKKLWGSPIDKPKKRIRKPMMKIDDPDTYAQAVGKYVEYQESRDPGDCIYGYCVDPGFDDL